MRIAVTYEKEDGRIFPHFGRAGWFKVYDVEGGRIVNSLEMPAAGSGHDALAGLLKQLKADVLICGGIGGAARAALAGAGIMVYPGIAGTADQAVSALLAGNLSCHTGAACQHRHGDGHDCGSCGHHHGEGQGCHHGSCGG